MASYGEDTFTGMHLATGNVNLVYKYLNDTEREALGDDEAPRLLNEQNQPQVDIECMKTREYKSGKKITEVYSVRVPETPQALTVRPGAVEFLGLHVNVYPSNGWLRESWSAEGIIQDPTNMADITSQSSVVNSFGTEDGE